MLDDQFFRDVIHSVHQLDQKVTTVPAAGAGGKLVEWSGRRREGWGGGRHD
jgi:hypothetical protein